MKLTVKRINVISAILMVILILMIMMPLYIMFMGAFKKPYALNEIPLNMNPFVDTTLDNIKKVLKKSDILLWFKNSFVIAISVCLSTCFIGLTAGYAFARIKFHGKNMLFALVLATMMMPKQMLLIPNFLVAHSLGLVDTMYGVILTTIAPAFSVFLCRQTIMSLPSELFDAAEIDGAGEVRKFVTVVVPLSTPALATISIFSFFGAFNDYLWQLVMISDKKLKTLPIGIAIFTSQNNGNKGVQLACAAMATLPLIILFFALQKFFIKGATVGAVKG